MSGKILVWLLTTLLLTTAPPAAAQQPAKKMARIGYLSAQSGPPVTLVAFKEGLGKLGWVEGKQIEFEYRYAGGQRDKLSEFATELVRLKVDVIVAGPGGAARAAKGATTTIPIVEAERAAKVLGATIQFAEMQGSTEKDLGDALGTVVDKRANALLVAPHPFFLDRRQRVITFAARNKLPAIYFSSTFVDDGGLMSYGDNAQDRWRRAATYVDKILKGTKPADLPVEQPMKFEFVVNLKTAKEIGVTIPQSVLYRADRVIN